MICQRQLSKRVIFRTFSLMDTTLQLLNEVVCLGMKVSASDKEQPNEPVFVTSYTLHRTFSPNQKYLCLKSYV